MRTTIGKRSARKFDLDTPCPVLDLDILEADLTYDSFGDEYGHIFYAAPSDAPARGTMLELIPSHCDPTVNLFERFHLTRGDAVLGEWPIDLRGCCQ